MTQAPLPSLPDPWAVPGEVPVIEAAQPPRERRRGLVVAGSVAALGVIGGLAWAGSNWLSGGGGPKPSEALPANTIAYAAADLDPSGSQKIDAIRFVMKLPRGNSPAPDVTESSDLRRMLFEDIQSEGAWSGLDYATDVEPWLGTRFGVALLPGEGGKEPTQLFVLPVKDGAAARAGLAKLDKSTGACEVGTDFALCSSTSEAAAAAAAAAKTSTLESQASFSGMLDRVGRNGVAEFWADSDTLSKELPSALGLTSTGLATSNLAGSGQTAAVLRFNGPRLELVGRTENSDTPFVGTGATSITKLPADTVAAFAIAHGGEQFKSSWASAEKGLAALDENAASSAEEALGMSIGDAVAAVLGTDFVLAFGGSGSEGGLPLVALRTDGAKDTISSLLSTLGETSPMTQQTVGEREVIATDATYAEKIGTGSGLGSESAFTDAVVDADKARIAAFIRFDKIAAQLPAADREQLAGLGVLGFSLTGEGTTAEFTLRLTTT